MHGGAFEQQHACAGAGRLQGGTRARDAEADDDHVEGLRAREHRPVQDGWTRCPVSIGHGPRLEHVPVLVARAAPIGSATPATHEE